MNARADWHLDLETAKRRVSTTLRHLFTEFSEFFHVSWTGLLIQASVGPPVVLGRFARSAPDEVDRRH